MGIKNYFRLLHLLLLLGVSQVSVISAFFLPNEGSMFFRLLPYRRVITSRQDFCSFDKGLVN